MTSDPTSNAIDPKVFGKVAVLLGGETAEREVSLNSGRLVLQGLRDAGIDAHPFDPAERPLAELKSEGFVRAFIALHGGYGENGQLQGALDFYGIKYTGSGVLGSALGLDKFRTKLVWQQTGVPTPPFEVVMRGDDYEAHAQKIVAKLGLPLFVKPASEGSSVAVIKVKSAETLVPALIEAAKFDKIVPAGEFYDYNAKYIADDTQYPIPCGLTAADEARMKQLSRRAFDVLGCTDWGRADFMMDGDGNPYFLEVNTAPGMTDHSLPPKAARAVGISYRDLVVKVLSLTLKD